MYNPKSLKAEEFISDEEIRATLEYAEANKNNVELIDAFFFGGIRFGVGALSLIPVILLFEKEKDLEKAEKKLKMKNTVIFGKSNAVMVIKAVSVIFSNSV